MYLDGLHIQQVQEELNFNVFYSGSSNVFYLKVYSTKKYTKSDLANKYNISLLLFWSTK